MKRYVALDTETTGKSDDGTPGDHRIIEVGCVEIVDRRITGRQLQVYIDPERPVDEEAAAIHGWTWDKLKGKPKFRDVAPQIIDFIRGSELLIHNAKFDTSFLNKEWTLAGINERTEDMAHVVDTVTLARKLVPGHQVNLDNLCNIFDIDSSMRTLHGALLDSQLLAEVYLAMTGGQESFTFQETAGVTKKWKRPQGIQLPLMSAEQDRALVHRAALVSLAQVHKISDGADGNTPTAGSDWGSGFEVPLLIKGEDEGKKDFKKRVSVQREELMQRLFTPDERIILERYLTVDEAAQKHWEDRVLGKVKDPEDLAREAALLAGGKKN